MTHETDVQELLDVIEHTRDNLQRAQLERDRARLLVISLLLWLGDYGRSDRLIHDARAEVTSWRLGTMGGGP